MLIRAAYSGCPVVDENGCRQEAELAGHRAPRGLRRETKRIRFQGAYLELFGQRVLPLPGLALRSDGGGQLGLPDPRRRA